MHEYINSPASCMCEDADDHSPCLECGSSKAAYIHVGDAAPVVSIEDGDVGVSEELSG